MGRPSGILPASQWEDPNPVSLSGPVLVVGGTDTGKTSFCAWLVTELARRGRLGAGLSSSGRWSSCDLPPWSPLREAVSSPTSWCPSGKSRTSACGTSRSAPRPDSGAERSGPRGRPCFDAACPAGSPSRSRVTCRSTETAQQGRSARSRTRTESCSPSECSCPEGGPCESRLGWGWARLLRFEACASAVFAWIPPLERSTPWPQGVELSKRGEVRRAR
jgi:hypothetical protein